MPAKQLCEICGYENDVASLYCAKCERKLPPPAEVMAKRARRRSPAMLFLRLFLLLALTGVLAAVLWPRDLVGELGSAAEGRAVYRQVIEAHSRLEDGRSARLALTERGINAYLAALVEAPASDEEDEAAPAQGTLEVEAIRVQILSDVLQVLVRAHWGPISLHYVVGLAPAAGEPGAFRVTATQFGRLPLPAPAHAWFAGRLVNLFSERTSERTLLDRLVEARLDTGKILLLASPSSR